MNSENSDSQALLSEEALPIEILRARIRASLDDPAPSLSAAQVFAELRAFHEEQVKTAKRR
ncbi:hypothetical protein [Ensifer soli]|uniref:hypothetical protein n=1 Tax=Ciceribacter sp. sgz301302 TaxID=3342379 RepID=UPI0035B7A998